MSNTAYNPSPLDITDTVYSNEGVTEENEVKVVKEKLYDTANPNPLMVALSIFFILFIIFVLYRLFLKPNATGDWVDDDNKKWVFNHDTLRNKLSVSIDGKTQNKCYMTDNLFKCHDVTGIWDYNNVILLIDGTKLVRLIN